MDKNDRQNDGQGNLLTGLKALIESTLKSKHQNSNQVMNLEKDQHVTS